MKISKELIRKFLVDRFLLQYNQHSKIKSLEFEHVAPLECIQMDPLRIVEKNQDLALHNRFDNYKPHMLEELAYKKRRLIEAMFNALCFVPTEEYRYHLIKHKELDERYFKGLKGLAPNLDLAKIAKKVKNEIKKNAPLSASFFESEHRIEWGYSASLKATTAALDYLWYSGQIVTDYRENGKRFYNLPENVLPEGIIRKPPTEKQYREFMLGKHMRTYHLGDLRFFRFGNMTIKAPERKKLVEPYLKKGELIPLEIQDVKQNYLISKTELELLQDCGDTKPDNRVRFMAPLDNMLFNRELIKDIFDFEYRWEVYAPKNKRKFGYYVMPILYNFDFIGRIDPKADRQSSTLVFNLVQLEDNVRVTKQLTNEIAKAAKRLARFAGMSDIAVLKTQPASLKLALTEAL